MDTLTFITLITALATLIGAISPIIVAFIQSGRNKQQKSILLPPDVVLYPRTKINWFVVLFFAVVSGVVGYGGAKIFKSNPSLSTVIPSNIETPISTSILTTKIPISNNQIPETPLQDSSVLFDEDFEDEKAQKISYISGEWQIITDETGNKVYDIDNSKSSGYPKIDFGSKDWKDYEAKFRVRFLEGDNREAIVYFRGTNNGAYVTSVGLAYTTINYTINGSSWKEMILREYDLEKNIWYWISVEAKGSEIKKSINDYVVINTDDTLFNTGSITMQAGQHTHMQIDDIQVTSLEK